MAIEVDDEIGLLEDGAGRVAGRGRGPAQDRLHAKDQLGRGERLGQVVVGSILEPGDAIEGRAARGQDQDRCRGRLVIAADGADDGPPVQPGEHQVEDDEGGSVAFDGVEGGRAVGRGHDRESFTFQVGPHEPDDLRVVIDHEDRALRDGRRGLVRHGEHGRGVMMGGPYDGPVTRGSWRRGGSVSLGARFQVVRSKRKDRRHLDAASTTAEPLASAMNRRPV